MNEYFYQVKNRHHESCGVPPQIDTTNKYTAYYQNIYGEQWVFVGDVSKETFTLYSGDIQWDNAITINLKSFNNPKLPIMHTQEQLWLASVFFTFMEIVNWKTKDYDSNGEIQNKLRRALDIINGK